MNNKVYYRAELVLQTALSIGAADSMLTDHDAVLDSRGMPVIPATSLTGALRACLDNDAQARVFGNLAGDYSESAVRVYDATHIGGNGTVSIRDSVSLERRVAIDGLKFDREIVERGARFAMLLEVLDENRCPCSVVEGLLGELHAGNVTLGAKKTRGMGRVTVEACKRASFDLTQDAPFEEWLSFDPFDAASWQGPCVADCTDAVQGMDAAREQAVLLLALRQVGGVSVREYTTEPESYDYSQLVVHEPDVAEDEEVPVIPGTSWAGALRERYAQFARPEQVDKLFGCVGSVTRASRIRIAETELAGGEWKTYTRNAIDRFTGGTIDRALFTQRSYYDGATRLELRIDLGEPRRAEDQVPAWSKVSLDASDLAPLVAVLADLHNGFLAVGGLASVGHGMFRIQKDGTTLRVRGKEVPGFADALLGSAQDDSDLVTPDLVAVAKLIAGEDKEVTA